MIDINYDNASKEFYVLFKNTRYNLTHREIQNLKEKLNSLEAETLFQKQNGN